MLLFCLRLTDASTLGCCQAIIISQVASKIHTERTFVKGDFEIWVLDFFNAKAGKDILIGRSYVDIDCIMYSLHKEKRVDEIINFLGLLHFFTERIL